MSRRWQAIALLALVLVPAARGGLIEPPPALVAMWEAKDGASVRAALLPIAALGEQPGASARQKIESGEAAWWLGVQDHRAGRADSALFHWRRAVAMRGDFDEGFALIDALAPFDQGYARPRVDQAYALAQSLATQAQTGMPSRLAEAQARLASIRQIRGRSDSALAGVLPWRDVLRPRPAWTSRIAAIELAGGDTLGAWNTLTLLSARTRQQDKGVESIVVRVQHALGYSDERRQITVGALRAPVEDAERRFMVGLGVAPEVLRTSDSASVHWFRVPGAVPAAGRRAPAPMLFVLAPGDSLVAADSLAAAFAAAGRTVVFLVPRGGYYSAEPMGPNAGAFDLHSWAGATTAFHTAVAADAARVMDLLAQRKQVPPGGWVVGAGGDCAPVALAIARARKDTQAIVLVAPRLPVVEVAEYRARLRAAGTRTFVQVSPEEPDALELGDLLSRQTAAGQVRVADSGQRGHGVAIFRADPKIAKRLLDWLAEPPAKR